MVRPPASPRTGRRSRAASRRRLRRNLGTPSPRKSRTAASAAASRAGGGSGIQRLSWKPPLVPARTSAAQALIASGCISRPPQAPRPPALATAMESEGGQAPAIGASRMGMRSRRRAEGFGAGQGRMFRHGGLLWSGSYDTAGGFGHSLIRSLLSPRTLAAPQHRINRLYIVSETRDKALMLPDISAPRGCSSGRSRWRTPVRSSPPMPGTRRSPGS